MESNLEYENLAADNHNSILSTLLHSNLNTSA